MTTNKENTINNPITNPEVDQVIAELKQGSTPEKQDALVEALKKARLLSPCDFDVDIQDGKAHPSQIKFFLVNTNDGHTFFPVFTELDKADKMDFNSGKPVKMVVRAVKDFDPLLNAPDQKATGLVLNPGRDNIVLPKNLISRVAGKEPVKKPAVPVNPAPLNVRFADPTVYPTKMAMAVYERASAVPEIQKVWLRMKLVGNTGSFVFIVETSVQEERILNEIREVSVPLSKNVPVEVIYGTEAIIKAAVGESTPLYDRDLDI